MTSYCLILCFSIPTEQEQGKPNFHVSRSRNKNFVKQIYIVCLTDNIFTRFWAFKITLGCCNQATNQNITTYFITYWQRNPGQKKWQYKPTNSLRLTRKTPSKGSRKNQDWLDGTGRKLMNLLPKAIAMLAAYITNYHEPEANHCWVASHSN